MYIGQRIKQARVHRGLTQKELGMMVGFEEKTADVRIAQYESSTRTPKADMRDKLAEAMNVNPRYFYDSHDYAAEDVMFMLFELDANHELELTPFQGDGRRKVNIHVSYNLVDNFLLGWAEKKQALANGEISKEEYMEWKLTWPFSASNPE